MKTENKKIIIFVVFALYAVVSIYLAVRNFSVHEILKFWECPAGKSSSALSSLVSIIENSLPSVLLFVLNFAGATASMLLLREVTNPRVRFAVFLPPVIVMIFTPSPYSALGILFGVLYGLKLHGGHNVPKRNVRFEAFSLAVFLLATVFISFPMMSSEYPAISKVLSPFGTSDIYYSYWILIGMFLFVSAVSITAIVDNISPRDVLFAVAVLTFIAVFLLISTVFVGLNDAYPLDSNPPLDPMVFAGVPITFILNAISYRILNMFFIAGVMSNE